MNRRLWLSLALFAAVWFGSLDYRHLIKTDEGRYAEIAREMAVGGDWLTPRLDGLKYFEKPPLQYWATATAFSVFGQGEWTARLWPALTGFLGVLLAAYTGRRLFGPAAGMATAALLASSLLYATIGHFNTLDMGFAFFLELAVFAFLFAQDGDRCWMLVAWVALAAAVLSKGIAAPILTGGTLVLYSLVSRDFSPWRKLRWLPGLGLFLVITAPWFVAVSVVNPEFPHFFFIHEHFERFLTRVHGRYEPPWYFIPILLGGALPWTSMALQSAWQAWARRGEADFQPRRFLLAWCVVVFGFFSASGSKLPSYILPLFPPLALLTAAALADIGRKAMRAHLLVIAALALVATLTAGRAAGLGQGDTAGIPAAGYALWLQVAAAIWLVVAVSAVILETRDRRLAAVVALASGTFIAGSIALLGHQHFGQFMSSRSIATAVKPQVPAGVPFYSVRMYEQTLPYYLDRTLTLVAYQDELAFGIAQEPEKWVPSMIEFKQRWNTDADAFAVMDPASYDELAADGLPMTLVARDARRVIVRKPR
jgi:4-amino-4-deoxy-L-arabinose transferase-like glycosyltransferase